MRTNEERVAAMHQRAAELKTNKLNRQTVILSTVCAAACLAIVIALAVRMPGMNTAMTIENTAGKSASLFSGNGMMGFIVVGIISFLLGISLTVFCFRLKKRQDEKDGKKDEDAS